MLELTNYFSNINGECYKELFDGKENCIQIKDGIEEYVNKKIEEAKENNSKSIYSDEREDINKGKYLDLKGDIIIGEGSSIDSFSAIEGPVIIGKNVVIGTNCYIRPYTIIGDNVHIGHGSEVKESVIMNSAKIATNCFVGDSSIGEHARIGSGTITANRRFDQKNIDVKKYDIDNFNNVLYKEETHFDFLGSIIGDNSRIGANVTLLPGTFVGHDTFIMPGLLVGGVIESDVLVNNDSYKTYKCESKERVVLK